jgi:hypothetical protein
MQTPTKQAPEDAKPKPAPAAPAKPRRRRLPGFHPEATPS